MSKLILFVPLLLVASVSITIGLCCLQLWWGALGLAIFTLLLNRTTQTYALNFRRPETPQEDTLRILTFNVNRAYRISTNKGTTQDLINMVLGQDADVVLLQEYSSILFPEVKEQLSAVYNYTDAELADGRFKSVFSKFPISDLQQLKVDIRDKRYKIFDDKRYCISRKGTVETLPICTLKIDWRGKSIQIVNCHLMSNNYSMVVRGLRKRGKPLWRGIPQIVNRIDFGYKARKLQAVIISNYVQSSDIPTIVCGDFNDVGGASTLRVLLKADMKDAWWNKGFGYGFTFHGMGMRFRLDHILYQSALLMLRNVMVIDSDVSDHRLLIADFKLL